MKIPFRSRTNNEGWLTSYADLVTNLLIFFVIIISASSLQKGKLEKIIQSISQNDSGTSLMSAEQQVKSSLSQQNLKQSVTVELTDQGLEIIFDSGVIFPSGSAEIISDMEKPLENVLHAILPFTTKYRIAIEGHTDEVPVKSGRFRSNWELSSARAMSIRERIEKIGVNPSSIRIEAYGKYKPLEDEKRGALDRETWLAKNRRVVVRLF